MFIKRFRYCTIAVLASALAVFTGAPVNAQSLEGKLDASLRFGLELNTEPDTVLGLNNFGSRVRYSGSSAINSSTAAIGYLELGVDDSEGLETTREGWIGLDGNFGKITVGTQYSALYDFATSKTDIANWGSCLLQLGCGRSTSTAKYSNQIGDSLSFGASARIDDTDVDDSLLEELGFAVGFGGSNLELGAGLVYASKEGLSKAGFGFEVAASMDLGSLQVAADFQYSDKNISARVTQGATKARTVLTLTTTVGNAYGVFSIANLDNTPFYITGGYTFNLSKNAYLYTELQANQPDLDNVDASLEARSVFVYTFDGIRTTSN